MDEDIKAAEQQIIETIRQRFVESSREKLALLSGEINDVPARGHYEGLEQLLRDIHELKGMGSTLGFHNISQIAAHLELYLEDNTEISDDQRAAIGVFLNRMNDCLKDGSGHD